MAFRSRSSSLRRGCGCCLRSVLLARLERALALLVDGPPDLPQRQRTLRATIDWSFLRLSDAAQRLFARLSVFAGGFTSRRPSRWLVMVTPMTPC